MQSQITAVVLAGGRGQRMGGQDKGWVPFHGRAMIEHVLERLEPQVAHLAINANRHTERYARLGHPVFSDQLPDYQGPLAGMAEALRHSASPWVLTAPCDSPLLPLDLVERMGQALQRSEADLAVASVDGRWQPVFTLLPCRLLDSLSTYLDSGERKIDRWMRQHQVEVVEFDDEAAAFSNVNTVEERQKLEAETPSGRPG